MIAAVVLAAGGARRFGAPKQLAELDGIPLVRHAVEAVGAAGAADRLLVVAGEDEAAVGAALAGTGAELVPCPGWAEGIAASLRAGVAAAAPADWVLVTLADEPLLPPAAVRAVVDAAAGAGAEVVAVRALWNGRPGHPVLLRDVLAGEVARLRGDEGARTILGGRAVLEIECGHLGSVTDVDTPADLADLQRRIPRS